MTTGPESPNSIGQAHVAVARITNASIPHAAVRVEMALRAKKCE
jgi:hypothetical protein